MDITKVIQPSRQHRSVDGTRLVQLREELGISQAIFALRAGYSQQFQAQIEAPGEHEITIWVARAIQKVADTAKNKGKPKLGITHFLGADFPLHK